MKRTYFRIIGLTAISIASQHAYAMQNVVKTMSRLMPVITASARTAVTPTVAPAARLFTAQPARLASTVASRNTFGYQPVENAALFGRSFSSTAIRHKPDFSSKDPYKVLDVKPGSSKKEIKAAYYKAMQENHPDTNNHPDAKSNAQKLNDAHAKLTEKDTDDQGFQAEGFQDDFQKAAAYHQTFYQPSANRQAAIDRSFSYAYRCELPAHIYGNFHGKGPHFFEGGRVIAVGLRSFDREPVDPDHVRGEITFRQFGSGILDGEYLEVEYTRPITAEDRAAKAKVKEILERELPDIEKRRLAILDKWVEYGALDNDYNYLLNKRENKFVDVEACDFKLGFGFILYDRYNKFGTTVVNKAERANIIFGNVVDQVTIDDLIYHKQWKCLDQYVNKSIVNEKWDLEKNHENLVKKYEEALAIHKQKQYNNMIDRMIGDSEPY